MSRGVNLDRGLGYSRSFNAANSDFASAALDLSPYSVISIHLRAYLASGSDPNALLITHASAGTGGLRILPNFGSGTTFLIAVDDTVNNWQDHFPSPTFNQWHDYLFVFDRATPRNLAWIDGIAQTLTTQNHDVGSYGNFANSTFALMKNVGSSLYQSGRLAEFALWGGVTLGQVEASRLNGGEDPRTIGPNLVALARFTDPSSPAVDYSGHGNSFALTGTSLAEGPPQLKSGWRPLRRLARQPKKLITTQINATATMSGLADADRRISPATISGVSSFGANFSRKFALPGENISAAASLSATPSALRNVTEGIGVGKTALSSTGNQFVGGYIVGCIFHVTSSQAVRAMNGQFSGSTVGGANQDFRPVIFACDSGGTVPTTPVAAGAAVTIPALAPDQLFQFPISAFLTPGYYFLAFWSNATSTGNPTCAEFWGDSSVGAAHYSPQTYSATGLPSTWGTDNSQDVAWTVYVSLTSTAIINAVATLSAGTVSKRRVSPATISATASVAAGTQSKRAVSPASIAATAAVSAAAQADRRVGGASISATASMSASLKMDRGFVAATINAIAAMSASTKALRYIRTTQINATATMSGLADADRRISPATINATATMSASAKMERGILAATISAIASMSGSIQTAGHRNLTPAQINAVAAFSAKTQALRSVSGNISAVAAISATTKALRHIGGNISAFATMSGNAKALRVVLPATISGISSMSAATKALRYIHATQIGAFATVSGNAQALRVVVSSLISATASMSARVIANKHITGANISANATMSGSLKMERGVLSASISAISSMSATTKALRYVRAAQINAFASMNAVASVLRAVKPATISGVAQMSASPSTRRAIFPAQVNAISSMSGKVSARKAISGGNINALSAVSAATQEIRSVTPAQISSISFISTAFGVSQLMSGGMILSVANISATSTKRNIISAIEPGSIAFTGAGEIGYASAGSITSAATGGIV